MASGQTGTGDAGQNRRDWGVCTLLTFSLVCTTFVSGCGDTRAVDSRDAAASRECNKGVEAPSVLERTVESGDEASVSRRATAMDWDRVRAACGSTTVHLEGGDTVLVLVTEGWRIVRSSEVGWGREQLQAFVATVEHEYQSLLRVGAPLLRKSWVDGLQRPTVVVGAGAAEKLLEGNPIIRYSAGAFFERERALWVREPHAADAGKVVRHELLHAVLAGPVARRENRVGLPEWAEEGVVLLSELVKIGTVDLVGAGKSPQSRAFRTLIASGFELPPESVFVSSQCIGDFVTAVRLTAEESPWVRDSGAIPEWLVGPALEGAAIVSYREIGLLVVERMARRAFGPRLAERAWERGAVLDRFWAILWETLQSESEAESVVREVMSDLQLGPQDLPMWDRR
jgi:hypothetical protein